MKWPFLFLICALPACRAASNDSDAPGKLVEPGVLLVGRIEHPRITESSGLVVSRKDPELFWTHNDGGGRRQVLYGITRHGRPVAEYRITGTVLSDWEDIAADDAGHLYLGDIGNNDAKRSSIRVHQITEPDPKTAVRGVALVTRSWNLHFPEAPFDCESLFIWDGSGWLVSKVFNDARANLYQFSLTNTALVQTLVLVGEIKIDSPVTGADLSRDGQRLGLVAKNGAYVFNIRGDPTRALKGKPYHNKFKADQIEACTFVPEGLLTTAESREMYLFTDEEFRPGPAGKK